MWSEARFNGNDGRPFSVNISDYSRLLADLQKKALTDTKFCHVIAYFVIEQILVWLASLESNERDSVIEGLDDDDKVLIYALLKNFYLDVSEGSRQITNADAFAILNSAWTTKSSIWISKRWGSLSKVVSTVIEGFAGKYFSDSSKIGEEAEQLLMSFASKDVNQSKIVLIKLVELVRVFGFSGLSLLLDKIDETEATSQSVESSAKLVYPILKHIQLLEVEGCSWVFFLWNKIRPQFNNKLSVRLDKISHTTIDWDKSQLKEMINSRLSFFSSDAIKLKDMFEPEADVESLFADMLELSTGSPRELIKLFDTIIREHDETGLETLLDSRSVASGADKYVVETIETWYPPDYLHQVYRVGKNSFTNADVRGKFRISAQAAGAKINNWSDVGLVKPDGTIPSDSGHKPVNKYVVSDPRVGRIIDQKLKEAVGQDYPANS